MEKRVPGMSMNDIKQPQAPSAEQDALSREIEKIIARELEPVRDELARLRGHVAALRDAFTPW